VKSLNYIRVLVSSKSRSTLFVQKNSDIHHEIGKMKELPKTVDKDISEGSDYDSFFVEDAPSTMFTRSSLSEGASCDDAEAENRYFGHDENRKVRKLKIVVTLVLFLFTSAVCVASFFLTTQGQQAEFGAS